MRDQEILHWKQRVTWEGEEGLEAQLEQMQSRQKNTPTNRKAFHIILKAANLFSFTDRMIIYI